MRLNTKDLANDLRTVRARKGHTQRELADATGIDLNIIRGIEQQKYDPKGPRAYANIAKLYKAMRRPLPGRHHGAQPAGQGRG